MPWYKAGMRKGWHILVKVLTAFAGTYKPKTLGSIQREITWENHKGASYVVKTPSCEKHSRGKPSTTFVSNFSNLKDIFIAKTKHYTREKWWMQSDQPGNGTNPSPLHPSIKEPNAPHVLWKGLLYALRKNQFILTPLSTKLEAYFQLKSI